MHPYIIAEIPGVQLENDYKNIMGLVLQLEKDTIEDMAQRAADIRKKFDIGKNVHKTHDYIKRVDGVIEIDSYSDSDYDESGYIPRMVKERRL